MLNNHHIDVVNFVGLKQAKQKAEYERKIALRNLIVLALLSVSFLLIGIFQ